MHSLLQGHSHSHPQGQVSWSELVGDLLFVISFSTPSHYKKVGDASVQSLAGFCAEQKSKPHSEAGVQHNRAGQ